MKRRNFILNGMGGLAGLIGLGASNVLMNNAMALPSATVGKNPIDIGKDLQTVSETIIENFKHKGHTVKILRRVYQTPSGDKVNKWIMKFNERELPQGYFRRLGDAGCYSSELLPFSDYCIPRKLAEELIDGETMNLYELNPTI